MNSSAITLCSLRFESFDYFDCRDVRVQCEEVRAHECGVPALAARGAGWIVRLQLLSTAWMWDAGGNCSTSGATRRRHAVVELLVLPNPRLGGLMGCCWWVGGYDLARCGLGRAVVVRSSGLAVGCKGGNCSTRSTTRRRHAVTELLMLPNPHSARCVGGVRCWGRWGECGCDRHQWVQ